MSPSRIEPYDNITGEALDDNMVAQSRQEDMQYMRNVKVFEFITIDEARVRTGARELRRQHESRSQMRVRCTSNTILDDNRMRDNVATFARTPLLGAWCAVWSFAVTREGERGERVIVILRQPSRRQMVDLVGCLVARTVSQTPSAG